MYLLAPISLVILNPIGFIILEAGRANNWDNVSISSETGNANNVSSRSKFSILLQVFSSSADKEKSTFILLFMLTTFY
jgi:hypothetical protein